MYVSRCVFHPIIHHFLNLDWPNFKTLLNQKPPLHHLVKVFRGRKKETSGMRCLAAALAPRCPYGGGGKIAFEIPIHSAPSLALSCMACSRARTRFFCAEANRLLISE